MKPAGPAFDPAFAWDPTLEAYVRLPSSPADCKQPRVTKLCEQHELFESHKPAELEDPPGRSRSRSSPPSKQAGTDAGS